MQARKARARMIRIVTWREDKRRSVCVRVCVCMRVCTRAIKEYCEYVSNKRETGLWLLSEDGVRALVCLCVCACVHGCTCVCVCSHNKWYSEMLLTEVNGSSRQGVPVEQRDE